MPLEIKFLSSSWIVTLSFELELKINHELSQNWEKRYAQKRWRDRYERSGVESYKRGHDSAQLNLSTFCTKKKITTGDRKLRAQRYGDKIKRPWLIEKSWSWLKNSEWKLLKSSAYIAREVAVVVSRKMPPWFSALTSQGLRSYRSATVPYPNHPVTVPNCIRTVL